MPVHPAASIPTDTSDGTDTVTGPYAARRLSDAGGLTQFGVIIETLPPGSRSSIKHWHSAEDELVYMLSGTLTLYEGDTVTDLAPGDTATFKAGTPLGHCLENTSDSDASFLVVGTRADRDTVTYPDDDRILTRDRTAGTRLWTDHAGHPASTPYAPD